MLQYPDYDRSILSAAASVLQYYGAADCPHKTLPELDAVLAKGWRNVIVLLFDGMGCSSLTEHLPENSFLRRHLTAPISSVFPPTTTAATTTWETGLSPIEHGWLGWDLYFQEIDDNVAIFRNTLQRDGSPAAPYNLPWSVIPHDSIFHRIHAAAPDVTAAGISPFAEYRVQTRRELLETVRRLADEPGRHYLYGYWYEPDSLMHQYGVRSDSVHRNITQIDRAVSELCRNLTDSLVIVTADHGLCDSRWAYLEDYPILQNMLRRPPSIEPRALSFYVKDGCYDAFRREFEACFGKEFLLLDKQQVLDSHLFGYGVAHPRAEGFIGDFLAVAAGALAIAWEREDTEFIGVHAGLTRDEMLVPLIVCECP